MEDKDSYPYLGDDSRHDNLGGFIVMNDKVKEGDIFFSYSSAVCGKIDSILVTELKKESVVIEWKNLPQSRKLDDNSTDGETITFDKAIEIFKEKYPKKNISEAM